MLSARFKPSKQAPWQVSILCGFSRCGEILAETDAVRLEYPLPVWKVGTSSMIAIPAGYKLVDASDDGERFEYALGTHARRNRRREPRRIKRYVLETFMEVSPYRGGQSRVRVWPDGHPQPTYSAADIEGFTGSFRDESGHMHSAGQFQGPLFGGEHIMLTGHCGHRTEILVKPTFAQWNRALVAATTK